MVYFLNGFTCILLALEGDEPEPSGLFGCGIEYHGYILDHSNPAEHLFNVIVLDLFGQIAEVQGLAC